MEYTVVGETVNVSARSAGINSHSGHSVLISGENSPIAAGLSRAIESDSSISSQG